MLIYKPGEYPIKTLVCENSKCQIQKGHLTPKFLCRSIILVGKDSMTIEPDENETRLEIGTSYFCVYCGEQVKAP